METVLGRRKGTADDYVLRAKIRWAVGMVRTRRFIVELGGLGGRGRGASREVPIEILKTLNKNISMKNGKFVYIKTGGKATGAAPRCSLTLWYRLRGQLCIIVFSWKHRTHHHRG